MKNQVLIPSTWSCLPDEFRERIGSTAGRQRLLIDVRDRAYDLSRQADLLHEDVKNSMEVAMIRRATEQSTAAQQMATAAHRLNTLAAW